MEYARGVEQSKLHNAQCIFHIHKKPLQIDIIMKQHSHAIRIDPIN